MHANGVGAAGDLSTRADDVAGRAWGRVEKKIGRRVCLYKRAICNRPMPGWLQ
jgi:hypothetical protein